LPAEVMATEVPEASRLPSTSS